MKESPCKKQRCPSPALSCICNRKNRNDIDSVLKNLNPLVSVAVIVIPLYGPSILDFGNVPVQRVLDELGVLQIKLRELANKASQELAQCETLKRKDGLSESDNNPKTGRND